MFRFLSKAYEKLRGFFLRLKDKIWGGDTKGENITSEVYLKDFLTTIGGVQVNVISTYVHWIQYYPETEIFDVNYLGTTCRYQGIPYVTARDVYLGRYPSKKRVHSVGNTARTLLRPLPYTYI